MLSGELLFELLGVLYDIELPYRHGNLFATKLPSYTLLLDTFWANFITVNLIGV